MANTKRARPTNGGDETTLDETTLDETTFDDQAEAKRVCTALDKTAEEFICPITRELPINPVIAQDGNVYERKAIADWIRKCRGNKLRSPLTNQPMGTTLLPAPHIRNAIRSMVSSGALTGDKAHAVKFAELENKANSGDADSMIELCLVFRNGDFGKETDLYKAHGWAKRAASLGHPRGNVQRAELIQALICKTKPNAEDGDFQAMFQLCLIYFEAKDFEQVFFWANCAAGGGIWQSLRYIAFCYMHGKGTRQSSNLCMLYLGRGVEQGCSYCLFSLCTLFQNGGYGVEKNLDEATRYHREFLSCKNTTLVEARYKKARIDVRNWLDENCKA